MDTTEPRTGSMGSVRMVSSTEMPILSTQPPDTTPTTTNILTIRDRQEVVEVVPKQVALSERNSVCQVSELRKLRAVEIVVALNRVTTTLWRNSRNCTRNWRETKALRRWVCIFPGVSIVSDRFVIFSTISRLHRFCSTSWSLVNVCTHS